MPWSLKRYQQTRDLHFITFSCYHRQSLLAHPESRRAFEESLERARKWYGFYISGYVVMPEHVHLLISEPKRKTLAVVIQMLKQVVTRRLRPSNSGQAFWQRRYYDFNVSNNEKRVEKLRYIHRNPSSAVWWINLKTGHGAASVTTCLEKKAEWKSSRIGLLESARSEEKLLK